MTDPLDEKDNELKICYFCGEYPCACTPDDFWEDDPFDDEEDNV